MWLIAAMFAVTYVGMAVGRLPGLQVDRAWIALSAACVLLLTGTVSLQALVPAVAALGITYAVIWAMWRHRWVLNEPGGGHLCR